MIAFLRLFGGLRLESAQITLTGRAIQKKRLALLALLGVTPGRRLSRDKLIAYLWPESDTERARHQLASSIYELRKALGEDAILAAGDEIALNPDRIGSDVGEFDGALRSGNRETAVDFYRGPFLDGFFLPEAEEFEHWVESERTRLAQSFAQTLEEWATEKEDVGDKLGGLELWRRLAAHDLYNSRVASRLVRALAASGDRAGALQYARTHTLLLRDQLGVEPDSEFTALMESFRGDPAGLPQRPHTPVAAARVLNTTEPSASTDEPPMAVSGAQASGRRSRAAVALFVVLALSAISALVLSRGGWEKSHEPIVVMMDSPHPSRVYDDEAVAASGTNADLINDILRDLPIQRVKETAGPLWHRDEEIRTLDPDLIVIHLSAFCTEACEPNRVRLRRFIEYMADTHTKFLIYSRFPPDSLSMRFNEMMGELPRTHPELNQRMHMFSVVEFGTPHWKDPATAAAFKLQVKQLLGISDEKG